MKQILCAILLLLAGLSGCARYDAAVACQNAAGGMPTQDKLVCVPSARGTVSCGTYSGVANLQSPEMQAYTKSVDDCMARYDQAQTQATQ